MRSDYQYSRFDSGRGASQSDFYLPQTYLFRALPALRSKLTLGQTYLSSAIFDSFRFAGLTLASDERMLPPSLQGYAPKISGIANSNAQVTVSQNGRILYQTRVSPGPFELPDLSQNISGNLDVSVRESDGSVRTWQVNTASVPLWHARDRFAIRWPPDVRCTAERITTARSALTFCSGGHLGAFNNTSLYGGLIASTGDYQSAALGIGQNMGLLGALSADVTRSDARLPHGQKQSGYSYRINYAKTFDKTGSTWRSSDTASRTAIFCPCRSTCSVGPPTAAMHGMKTELHRDLQPVRSGTQYERGPLGKPAQLLECAVQQ